MGDVFYLWSAIGALFTLFSGCVIYLVKENIKLKVSFGKIESILEVKSYDKLLHKASTESRKLRDELQKWNSFVKSLESKVKDIETRIDKLYYKSSVVENCGPVTDSEIVIGEDFLDAPVIDSEIVIDESPPEPKDSLKTVQQKIDINELLQEVLKENKK